VPAAAYHRTTVREDTASPWRQQQVVVEHVGVALQKHHQADST
jgi:hypothetical protein